jgi:hypothetical protein
MSFGSLLRHKVLISQRRPVLAAGLPTYDARGQQIVSLQPVGEYRTRIQQLTAREIALLGQAGAVIGDHRLYFFAGTPVDEASQVQPQPADGRLFEITRVNDLGGEGRYLEVFATLVTSTEVPAS